MKHVQHFNEVFATWGIQMPPDDATSRKAGKINKSGWSIKYCFGRDDSGEYLDYLSWHRMAGERHERIHSSGAVTPLPTMRTMRPRSDNPIEEEQLKREFYEHNTSVQKMLDRKGFGVTPDDPTMLQINQALLSNKNDSESTTQSHAVTLEELRRLENDEQLANLEAYLKSELGQFNIFDALGIARAEIRHSRFLAFLLDPAASHGLGQQFIKAFLTELCRLFPGELAVLSKISLETTELAGVEVACEWRNIDIRIMCEEPRFAVVIENKIGSQDHDNQLDRYSKTMKDEHPDFPAIYLYLTPTGEPPTQPPVEKWYSIRYSDIHRIVGQYKNKNESQIARDLSVLIDHYLKLLKEQFMNDPKVDDLCKKIYRNHGRALKMIFEYAQNELISEVRSSLEDDGGRWRVVWQSSTRINFVPEEWMTWMPEIGSTPTYTDRKIWLVLKYEMSDKNELQFLVQVQKLEEIERRREIVKMLLSEFQKCGFAVSKQAKKPSDEYTSITPREKVLQWDDSPKQEEIRDAIGKHLKKLAPKIEKLGKNLRDKLK